MILARPLSSKRIPWIGLAAGLLLALPAAGSPPPDWHDETGFEWCVNQPAVDSAGVTYANAEDGYVYALGPSGAIRERIFLNFALGAAYTSLSIGADGGVYSQNYGRLFAVGKARSPRETPERPEARSGSPRIVTRP